MNLMDALKSRRSIRRYQSRPIPKDLAESLIVSLGRPEESPARPEHPRRVGEVSWID
ncbi:hypothetical protein [Methanothrix sp.]|uniref:hypothetical protein n=1 Tax=Methanothrix sp. TaxID=90426 RepID=UPI0032985023